MSDFYTTVINDDGHAETSATMAQVFGLYNQGEDSINAASNKSTFTHSIVNGLESFSGCAHDAFKQKNYADLKSFEKARSKSGLEVAQNQEAKRRKRVKSEYDGEWSLDRRYDDKPFQATKKLAKPAKVITLDCLFSLSCHVGAKEIQSYGIKAWALAESLESSGVQVKINVVNQSDYYGTKKIKSQNVKVTVKDFGQYVDMKDLCQAFTPAFYRRGIFALKIKVFDDAGATIPSGLGVPSPRPTPCGYNRETGTVTVSTQTDFDKIRKELTQ